MTGRTIIICPNDDEVLIPETEEDDEPVCIAENADDYEEVLRRQDDIDQLTSEYIKGLLGVDVDDFDIADIGIDTAALNSIEDAFEDILYEFGITIYRPIIVTDEDGNEVFATSAYEE